LMTHYVATRPSLFGISAVTTTFIRDTPTPLFTYYISPLLHIYIAH
jgi:hypothetical protein